MGKIIKLGNCTYELIQEYRDGFQKLDVENKYTDYFEEFDYIFGDYSYDKLRLKGFYDSKNSRCRGINDIHKVDEYIKNYCAYGCRYFVLQKKN